MGQPAGQPAESEHDGEHVRRQAHRPVDDAAVEVDVRVELSVDEEVVLEGDLLQIPRDRQQRIVHAEFREHLVRGALQDAGARVEVLVDPVPEAHQAEGVVPVLGAADELAEVVSAVADRLQHLDHLLVRAAVKRPRQGVDAGRDGGEQAGAGTADHADRRGGAVLLVVGVQDEQHVQGPGQDRRRLVVLARDGEHHVQEVLRVAEVVLRVDEGLADRLLVGERGDGRQLGDETDDVQVDVLFLGVEGGQRRDHRGQDGHRMGRRRVRLEELLHVLVDQRVPPQPGAEVLELLFVGQLAVDQQVADLDEGRLLRELLDGVAAVAEDPLLAVDEGDRAAAGTGVAVARVQCDRAGQAPEGVALDRHFALGADDYGEFVLLVLVGQFGRFHLDCLTPSSSRGTLPFPAFEFHLGSIRRGV